MNRRSLLQLVGTAGVVSATGLSGRAAALSDPQKLQGEAWKVDVTIYDRPGWSSTSYGLPLIRRESGELLIGFQEQSEDGVIDDFYSAHAEWVFLSLSNGGKSWHQTPLEDVGLDPRWSDRSQMCTNAWPVRLPDGTLINVVEDVLPGEAQKERLEKLGIGHLWHPDGTFGWDLWPASFTERLKAEGLVVFDKQGPWLPAGVVATHARPLVVTISSDGGATWKTKPIEGLPKFSRVVGWFRRGVVLPDGTVLGPIYGQIKGDGSRRSWYSDGTYILRSEDRGNSWRLIPLAYDPSGKQGFNETDLLLLPNGRILAMIRSEGAAHLYRSYSDDGGRTWTTPVPTKIPGSPAHLLHLKSGNLLCTYRYAGYPDGYRAVLSRDQGETWDIDNEKIIRDDTLPGLVGYPSSVQLGDGTIFTIYNVLRAGPLKAGDNWKYKETLTLQPPLHSYLAGSIYTEDFVRPLRSSG